MLRGVLVLALSLCVCQGQYYTGYLDMLNLVNQQRVAVGVNPLCLSAKLMASAQAHSQYQASTVNLTHYDPIGDLVARIQAVGYNFQSGAENVATSSAIDVNDVMTRMMADAAHAGNVIGSSYTHFGSGVALGADGTYYWTQHFAAALGPEPCDASATSASVPTPAASQASPASSSPQTASSSPYYAPSSYAPTTQNINALSQTLSRLQAVAASQNQLAQNQLSPSQMTLPAVSSAPPLNPLLAATQVNAVSPLNPLNPANMNSILATMSRQNAYNSGTLGAVEMLLSGGAASAPRAPAASSCGCGKTLGYNFLVPKPAAMAADSQSGQGPAYNSFLKAYQIA